MEEESTTHEEDTKCGFGAFRPEWMQVLASKKVFVIVYAVAGMQQYAMASYSIGTMSTIEKNFKMSSQQSGMIAAAWDIGTLIANVGITYVAAKGHRTRWVAMGVFIVGLSSFLRVLPYQLFGSGETVKMYTREYGYSLNSSAETLSIEGNTTGIKKLSTNVNCGLESEYSGWITFYILVLSQIILGVGTSVYWTCGATYLDDNVRKNVVPVLLSVIQVIRLFGPTVGFLLSFFALRFYVDPHLTPTITKEDPRWVGAWWLGWYPIGISCLIFSGFLIFFPRSLPGAAARRRKNNVPPPKPKTLSLADFKASFRRIITNQVIVFNTLSAVCFILGLMAHWTFMPKYLESQFRLSASKSSFVSGTFGILCNALGVLLSGFVITKYKPPPRFLAGWTVFVELIQVLGYVSYAYMSCEEQKYHGHWGNGHNWNLTESCNVKFGCGNDIQFAPVCDETTGLAFYSPCHAGCTSTIITINKTVEYGGCACVPGSGKVIEGLCPTDCNSNIILFVGVMGVLSFFSATGRTANTLLQFRCVSDEDKSLSIGVAETVLAILGIMPAPLLYGIIMGFLLAGTLLDVVVWYYSKGLKIYDEDYDDQIGNNKSQQPCSETNTALLNREANILPLAEIPNNKNQLED